MASKNMDRAAQAAFICHLANKVLKEIFDKEFLKEIKVASFREGTLYFEVASSCYAQELKIKEREIVSETNRSIGEDLVKGIRFKPNKISKF